MKCDSTVSPHLLARCVLVGDVELRGGLEELEVEVEVEVEVGGRGVFICTFQYHVTMNNISSFVQKPNIKFTSSIHSVMCYIIIE